MAHKIKDVENYFLRLRKAYDEIIADDPQPGLLDELDGDRRIIAHAVFYIVSRVMTKKLDGMGPFELLRIVEERLLRIFIAEPNSERVDRMLEKADLLYELLPYMITKCIAECADDEEYSFPQDTLFETQGLLIASGSYAIGVEDDMLDPIFDSLSLLTGKIGSPIIEADATEIMELAKRLAYDIDDEVDDLDDEEEAPTIAELRALDVNRQMLVIGLLSVNTDAFVKEMDCLETTYLHDDVAKAKSAFDDNEPSEYIDECIDEVIESIKDVVSYIVEEGRPRDNATNLLSTMFSGMLAVYIRDAHGLSDKDFVEVWSKVRPNGRFDDKALISYSRKIIDRDLPSLFKEFIDSQKTQS